MKNIYLDTETTGFVPGQIAELTMIVEDPDNGNSIKAYNYFFTVDKMDSGAEDVHGFSVEKLIELSGGVRFSDTYQEILSILSDSNLVAHNEAFDEKFISSELWRCGVSFQPAARTCTMNIFKEILKIPAKYKKYGQYKNPKLSEVMEYLKIDSNKVREYSEKLFNYTGGSFHDSRFDTTGMYVAVNVYREKIHGGSVWHNAFCV